MYYGIIMVSSKDIIERYALVNVGKFGTPSDSCLDISILESINMNRMECCYNPIGYDAEAHQGPTLTKHASFGSLKLANS
jgi:hypothetical protein